MININYKYVKPIGGNKVCIFNSISDFQNSSHLKPPSPPPLRSI